MVQLLDFESRSRADLTKCGGRLYWEHTSTEALCCVLHDTESSEVRVWLPGDPCPITDADVLAAHNLMGFDRFALARLGWRSLEASRKDIDTSELARRAGLPGSLDAIAKRLLGGTKDKAASKFTKALSTVRKPKDVSAEDWRALTKTQKRERGAQRELAPGDLGLVLEYCMSDVQIMAGAWPELVDWLDAGRENDVSRVDRIVNDRGISFDVQLARRLLAEDARNSQMLLEDIARELGADWTAARVRACANSPAQFCKLTGAFDATAATIQEMLTNAVSKTGYLLALARQGIASIARGKLEAGLARVSSDGRLRDTHRYIGAHTWRFSGRGMQLQNMPRPEKRFEKWGDAEICALADRVLGGAHADQGEIDLLLRACLWGGLGKGLVECDFSGVEARANAWCAGDQAALDVFASPVDPYLVAATGIFQEPVTEKSDPRRQAGKVAELACGYGGGAGALERMAHGMGIDLESLGVDAQDVVCAWRELHAPIVRFWYDLQRAFISAANGTPARVSHFEFSASGDDVAIFFPMGGCIVYPKVRISKDHKGRPQISYEGQKEARAFGPSGKREGEPLPMREKIYGGLLCENVIQRLCRDLMVEALVKAEDAGLDPVLHVHDSIAGEVPACAMRDAYECLREIMLDSPDWAEGFPVGAAGHWGLRYRK